MVSNRTTDLIDKMSNMDKDIRFMAVNDLIENITTKSICLDDMSEKSVSPPYSFYILG